MEVKGKGSQRQIGTVTGKFESIPMWLILVFLVDLMGFGLVRL